MLIFILLIQVLFVFAILAIVLLKKYTLWKQELHFEKSLDDLNEKLKQKLISGEHYRNCRYDLEQLYRSYFEKWR